MRVYLVKWQKGGLFDVAKNIVILTMGLEIGGAETHIVELAIALKNQGHNITVFSNGGAYVERLESLGIAHIHAPMNNKHPVNLWRSYKIVKHFCKKQRVSVIHSHTRITNFIAHNVCKRMRIPMVTTVHGRFRLGMFAKFFSKWGDRAIAVSEDLRQYVIDGYNMSPDKVSITVNGIDLENFSKSQNSALRTQYGISDENKIILCVTRIDPDASESAFRLLEAAPLIYKSAPDTKIMIVGGGKQFEQLKQRVNEVNACTDANFAQALGAKTNIADYLHIADAFVGVSRAALEAMACEVPTVLIGNGGYLGIYSAETHAACIGTNFTCRGYPHISADQLAQVLLSVTKQSDQYAENIKAARQLVEQCYSVTAMASDALAAYTAAEDDLRPVDLMLSGYYGTHNFGDDITLNAIIQNISKEYPLKNITILNHSKKNDYKDKRIRVIHRFDLLHILPMMRKSKLFMLGGGSLLQDVTSNRSIFFYLFMLRFANKLGCKTMIYGNGIGPIIKKRHQRQLLKILKKVDRITIRDNVSYNYLLKNGLGTDSITLTADEAYNYDITGTFELPNNITFPADKKILLINLRTYTSYAKDISSDIAAAVKQAALKHDLFPVLLPVQFTQDYPLLQKVSAQLDISHHIFTHQLSEQQIIALIQKCDCVLTERLHPVVFAARMQKPFVCIVYDPKVSATAHKFNMHRYALDLTEIDATKLYDTLTEMLQHQSEITETLAPIARQQYESACLNSQIAGQLLSE